MFQRKQFTYNSQTFTFCWLYQSQILEQGILELFPLHLMAMVHHHTHMAQDVAPLTSSEEIHYVIERGPQEVIHQLPIPGYPTDMTGEGGVAVGISTYFYCSSLSYHYLIGKKEGAQRKRICFFYIHVNQNYVLQEIFGSLISILYCYANITRNLIPGNIAFDSPEELQIIYRFHLYLILVRTL